MNNTDLKQLIKRLETELEYFESGDKHKYHLACVKLKLDITLLKESLKWN
uniref:Uncharacterized protein n=1 Tax=viral metagenome TaxID=1070528 RepID=A0A6M3JF52_9ZZZZ